MPRRAAALHRDAALPGSRALLGPGTGRRRPAGAAAGAGHPKPELRALARLLEAGLDFPAVYLAHEVPTARLAGADLAPPTRTLQPGGFASWTSTPASGWWTRCRSRRGRQGRPPPRNRRRGAAQGPRARRPGGRRVAGPRSRPAARRCGRWPGPDGPGGMDTGPAGRSRGAGGLVRAGAVAVVRPEAAVPAREGRGHAMNGRARRSQPVPLPANQLILTRAAAPVARARRSRRPPVCRSRSSSISSSADGPDLGPAPAARAGLRVLARRPPSGAAAHAGPWLGVHRARGAARGRPEPGDRDRGRRGRGRLPRPPAPTGP